MVKRKKVRMLEAGMVLDASHQRLGKLGVGYVVEKKTFLCRLRWFMQGRERNPPN